MNLKKLTLAIALAGVATLPAAAAVFDFARLHAPTLGSDFLPSDGVPCTGGDLCSSNANGGILNDDLTYTDSGITLKATGTFNLGIAAVVQDHDNGYNPLTPIGAGLGVYHLANTSSDDNITTGEVLTITFDQVVTLTEIQLRAEGHGLNWTPNAHFLFDGVSTLLQGTIALNKTGTVFTFAFGGTAPDQFYLAGATAKAAVAEPESLGLIALGLLGGLAAARRRR